jgi:hypothetical protein
VIERPSQFENIQKSKRTRVILRQFFVGGGVSVLNIAIHALVMTTVVRVAQVTGILNKSRSHSMVNVASEGVDLVYFGDHQLHNARLR